MERETTRQFIDKLYRKLFHRASAGSGLFIGHEAGTRQPIMVAPESLNLHTLVVGGSGRGKSNSLCSLVWQLIRRKAKYNEGFSIVDPHGELSLWALDAIARALPHAAPDIFYLDVSSAAADKVLSFNPLVGGGHPYFVAQSLSEGVIRAFDLSASSQDKPLLLRTFVNIAEALVTLKLSLAEARWFLYRGQNDRAVFRHLMAQLPPGDLRSFFENFDQLPPHQADTYTLGVTNRLDALIRSPLRRILGQTENTVDLRRCMDDGRICLFNLSREGAGITSDGQRFFAALIVSAYRASMEQRRPNVARPHTLILDECSDYAGPDLARALTSARKYNLRIVACLQSLSQARGPDGDQRLVDTLMAVPNRLIFGALPPNDARQLAEIAFLAALDPDKIKYQGVTPIFKPIPTPVTVTSTTRSSSETRSSGRSSTRGTAAGDSKSASVDAWGVRNVTGIGASTSSSVIDSASDNLAAQDGWSETTSEGWTTFFEELHKKDTPVYRALEEQVFSFSQRMNLNPRGVCVVTTADSLTARVCHIPYMKPIVITDEERGRFREQLFSRPEYLTGAQADQQIEDRRVKLIAAAPVLLKPKPARVPRNQPFRVKDSPGTRNQFPGELG